MNKYKENIVMFHSKSPELDLRYLSNFEPSNIEIFMLKFPSIEHGFQAMKYIVSGYLDYSLEFCIGQKYGKMQAKDIKKEGGKTGFKKRKVEFSIKKWEKYKHFIMKQLINSRYTTDKKYKFIIDQLKLKNIKLFHYENTRGKGVSYWGGSWSGELKKGERDETNFKGKNILGKLVMNAKKTNINELLKLLFLDKKFQNCLKN